MAETKRSWDTARRASMTLCACILLTTVAACAPPPCKNEAFYGLPSPNGKYIAFIFHRTCPAPEGVSTQVSLMPFHESLRSDPGNVLSVAGEQPVTASWQGPTTLRIAGFKDSAFQRREPLDGVAIEFH